MTNRAKVVVEEQLEENKRLLTAATGIITVVRVGGSLKEAVVGDPLEVGEDEDGIGEGTRGRKRERRRSTSSMSITSMT